MKFLVLFLSFLRSAGKLNKEFYLHHGVNKKKILPAPYFVDQKFFNIKKNENIIKKRLRLKEKKIIIFVGKLIYRKNPLEFLNLAKISQDQNQFKFLMIGDGHLKKNCQKYIKKNNLKNVSLLGFVNQKELRDYYKASDLLIVPSEYETWGLNINEAFATNTPVICTSECGASEDLIINGKTGFAPVMELFDDNECKEKGIHTFRFTEEDILRSEILKFIVNKLENNPIAPTEYIIYS